MGKTRSKYISAVAKRLQAAANDKNLMFLADSQAKNVFVSEKKSGATNKMATKIGSPEPTSSSKMKHELRKHEKVALSRRQLYSSDYAKHDSKEYIDFEKNKKLVVALKPTDNEFKPTPKFQHPGTSVSKELKSELRQTTVPRQFVSPEICPHKQQNKDKTDLADESIMSNDSVDLSNTDSDTGAENHHGEANQSKMDRVIRQNTVLKRQNNKLKRSYSQAMDRIFRLTDILNAKVCGEPTDMVFTEVLWYPERVTLRRFSEATTSGVYYERLKLKRLKFERLKSRKAENYIRLKTRKAENTKG
ncbi:uncharacterized protein LOC129718456 [Wyeomyia smithii]|uniref:uncharacterized protein LOC129718456 n=1 Tax=Wyeomyia smithii TaxID=174621 RepID=UPI0024681FCE|nr:uncharacterized protein LOC129718456 [Wyeomyia smithii]